MKLICLLALIMAFQWRTEGLICWVCVNEPSNEDCLGKGDMKICQPNQNACQNEVRRENGIVTVTKRCKQSHACDNNNKQNPQPAWEPTQCNDLGDSKVSVCRCCCDTDFCNSPEQDCIGTLSNPYPTPIPLCESLQTPDHGSKSCNPDEENYQAQLETVCTFKCDPGYLLVGSRTSTCSISPSNRAAYDNPAPYCKLNPTCPRLRNPKFGRTTCDTAPTGRRYAHGTVCKFSCQEGFILRGSFTSVCLKTTNPTVSKFNRKPPQCRPNPRCEPIGSPEFGHTSCSRTERNGFPPGTVCEFTCNRGYVLEGYERSTCLVGSTQTDADFNNPVPTCVPNPQCVEIRAPRFGSKSCSQDGRLVDIGTECVFQCNDGYDLIGSTGSTCVNGEGPTDAEFDNPTPTCRANPKCDTPSTPQFGTKECDQETNQVDPETVCDFQCNEGYVMNGEPRSTCLVGPRPTEANFDHPTPTCRPDPKCNRISAPEFGTVTCRQAGSQVDPGTVCFFDCRDGYILIGSARSTCLVGDDPTKAEFSNPIPVCQPDPKCTRIGAPRWGSTTCTQNGNLVNPGTVCNFECNRGYDLEGAILTTCLVGTNPTQADWDEDVPRCIPNPQCPIIGTPRFGSKLCTQDGNLVDPGTVCSFECDEGYALVGDRQSTCEAHEVDPLASTFDNPVPFCEPNPKCPLIGIPTFGSRDCQPNENPTVDPGTICTFKCNEGYTLEGSPFSICMQGSNPTEAMFNNPVPTCAPNPMCDLIGIPDSGTRSCTQRNVRVVPGTVCSFECNDGYILEGDVQSTCRAATDPLDSAFDNPVPVCTPNPMCNLIGTPRFGSKVCTQDDPIVVPGTACTFSCEDGYILRGSDISTCVAADIPNLSRFDNPVPICTPDPMCPTLGDPDFGTTRCTQDGPAVDPGTICQFECNNGYILEGSRISTCIAAINPVDSAFNNPVPQCIPNPMCDLIGVPTFGRRSCTQNNLRVLPGTVCSFTCNEGYLLFGSDESTCREDTNDPLASAFDNPVPVCSPNPMCDLIGDPDFGSKTCTQDGSVVLPGTKCTFQCDEGYVLRGDEISTCIAEVNNPGLSAFDNPVPFCIPNPMCDIIETPQFGTKDCSLDQETVPPGTSCLFACNSGYVLVGSRVSTCRRASDPIDSAFDNPVPVCTPNPMCDLIGIPTFGSRNCTQEMLRVSPGTVCDFQCNQGYILRGSEQSTCREAENPNDSSFDNPVPVCSPDPVCEIIGDPEFGSKTCTEDGAVVPPGTECSFKCNDGYLLVGDQLSTCRAAANPINSAFDNPVPRCRPNPMCDLIGIPDFGSRSCTQETARVRPGTRCTFTCDDGYVLQGSVRSVCRAAPNPIESAFDNPVPICTPDPMCEIIGDPEFGSKRCTETGAFVSPGATCSFQCNDGYILRGDEQSTCVEAANPIESAFDNPVPVCTANPICALIGIPEFGSRSCSKEDPFVSPGTVCSFTCNDGYQLDGSTESTCRAASNPIDSAFDNPVPVCIPNPKCNLIGTPTFGTRSCTQEDETVDPGTVCLFTCNDGYELVGSRRSTCRGAANPLHSAFDNPVPVCRPDPMCNLIGIPTDGTRSCQPVETSKVPPRTVCSFACNEGYLLQGSSRSTCREASNPIDSAFDNPVPVCIPNPKCDLIGTPTFGTRSCTQEDETVDPGTVCLFTCNDGYELVGSRRSTCRGAANPLDSAFDNPVPVCRPDPMCNLIGIPTDGTRSCQPVETSTVPPRTVCSFACNEGYLLQGSRRSTCRAASNPIDSTFDNPVPICSPNPMCELIGIPEFGSRACSLETALFVSPGTSCDFTCEEGYVLVGSRRSICRSGARPIDAEFDNDVPICEPNPMCELIGTPEFGSKECLPEENPLVTPGTTCNFICNEGFVLDGDHDSTCQDVGPSPLNAVFNNPVPTCRPEPRCDTIGPLPFGTITCSQGGSTVAIGTDCQFKCNDGYVRVGAESSTCVGDTPELLTASFDNPLPVCRPGECDELVPILNGNIRCTNQNEIGSVCDFSCNREGGFALFPPDRRQTECLSDTATWSVPNPCCVLACPLTNMDLVLVLDSSGSITQPNWDALLQFLDGFLQSLDIAPGRTMVSVLTYSTEVEKDAVIRLTSNKASIRRRVRNLQWIGLETFTGKALRYTRNEILQHNHDDRGSVLPGRESVQDVVLLITDGASDDNAIRQARRLRQDAIIYAVGVEPGGFSFIDRDELRAIAGSEDRVRFVDDGYQALNDEFSMELMTLLCGQPSCPS